MNALFPRKLVVCALLIAACDTQRPSSLPRDEDYLVVIESCRLPNWMDWFTQFAQHTWIDVKAGSEDSWRRIEIPGETTGVRITHIDAERAHSDWRWSRREVRVLATIRGERARRISEQIDAAARKYDELFERHYHAWPGPNSNTLVRWLARDVPELAFAFDHNALGKDYGVHAGLTPSRTGFSLDASVIGVALAFEEGFELHFLGLTFGVQFAPPRLELPFLPELPWPRSPSTPPKNEFEIEGLGK